MNLKGNSANVSVTNIWVGNKIVSSDFCNVLTNFNFSDFESWRNWDDEFSGRESVLEWAKHAEHSTKNGQQNTFSEQKDVCVLSLVYIMSTDNAMGSEAFSNLIASVNKKELINHLKIALVLFFFNSF